MALSRAKALASSVDRASRAPGGAVRGGRGTLLGGRRRAAAGSEVAWVRPWPVRPRAAATARRPRPSCKSTDARSGLIVMPGVQAPMASVMRSGSVLFDGQAEHQVDRLIQRGGHAAGS